VINKADRPGVAETRRDLERMLDLTERAGWRPPVVATTSPTGEGIDELWAAVGGHRAHLESSGDLEDRRAARVGDELTRILAALLEERARATAGPRLDDLAAAVAARELDPWSAAAQLLPPD
jgi:LAO/AO transport system kinase